MSDLWINRESFETLKHATPNQVLRFLLPRALFPRLRAGGPK